jgi:hypothetical protein
MGRELQVYKLMSSHLKDGLNPKGELTLGNVCITGINDLVFVRNQLGILLES